MRKEIVFFFVLFFFVFVFVIRSSNLAIDRGDGRVQSIHIHYTFEHSRSQL